MTPLQIIETVRLLEDLDNNYSAGNAVHGSKFAPVELKVASLATLVGINPAEALAELNTYRGSEVEIE